MLRKYAANLQEKHPYRSAISIKLLCNFIKITLRHGCSPLNLLHIFRTQLFRTPLVGCFCTFMYWIKLKLQWRFCSTQCWTLWWFMLFYNTFSFSIGKYCHKGFLLENLQLTNTFKKHLRWLFNSSQSYSLLFYVFFQH